MTSKQINSRMEKEMTTIETIRYSASAMICMVWHLGEPVRCATQNDMDTLPVGPDMTDDEVEALDD